MIEQLKQIPHLRLPLNFDVQPLIDEYRAMPEMIGYELPGEDRTEAQRRFYRDNWKGRGLIDFEPDSSKGMLDARAYQGGPSPLSIETGPDSRPIMHRTELAERAPLTMLCIEQIFQYPGRCRVTEIRSGGGLHWHSHCQFQTGNYEEHDEYNLAIVHIPLITNREVNFGVTKFPFDPDDGNYRHWQHYAAGECWLLNAWHSHIVRNEGFTDRVHLMLYGTFSDPTFLKLVAPALAQYDGLYVD